MANARKMEKTKNVCHEMENSGYNVYNVKELRETLHENVRIIILFHLNVLVEGMAELKYAVAVFDVKATAYTQNITSMRKSQRFFFHIKKCKKSIIIGMRAGEKRRSVGRREPGSVL